MSFKKTILSLGLAFLVPGLALPAAVSLNGTCVAGSCSTPDVLSAGQSTGGNFGWDYTFANGDKYYISGTYGGSYDPNNGIIIASSPNAIYLGNSGNSHALSQADVLTFNILQNYNYTSGSLDGYYYYYFQSLTSGPIAQSSSYTADLAFDGQHIGATTYGTGYSGTNGFNQKYFSGLTNPLMADYILTLSFGAGSGVGAAISTVTPEPSSVLLLSLGGLGILGLGLISTRRKISQQVSK